MVHHVLPISEKIVVDISNLAQTLCASCAATTMDEENTAHTHKHTHTQTSKAPHSRGRQEKVCTLSKGTHDFYDDTPRRRTLEGAPEFRPAHPQQTRRQAAESSTHPGSGPGGDRSAGEEDGVVLAGTRYNCRFSQTGASLWVQTSTQKDRQNTYTRPPTSTSRGERERSGSCYRRQVRCVFVYPVDKIPPQVHHTVLQ